MKTLIRAALVAASIVVIGLAGSTSARAASPEPDTIGAAVQKIVYLDDGVLAVRNMSTIEAVFAFEADGWIVEPSTLTLRPDEQAHVVVSGDGADGSTVAVTVTSSGEVAQGSMRTALAFSATVRRERPFDPSGWFLGALAAAFVAGVLLVVGVRVAQVARRYRVARTGWS